MHGGKQGIITITPAARILLMFSILLCALPRANSHLPRKIAQAGIQIEVCYLAGGRPLPHKCGDPGAVPFVAGRAATYTTGGRNVHNRGTLGPSARIDTGTA